MSKIRLRKQSLYATVAFCVAAACVACGVMLVLQQNPDGTLPSDADAAQSASTSATVATLPTGETDLSQNAPADAVDENTISCTVQNVADEPLPQAVRTLLSDYVLTYYTALGTQTSQPLTEFFHADTVRGKMYAALNQAVMEHRIFINSTRALDLTFTASVQATVEEWTEKDGVYTVTYMLSAAQRFACMDTTTYTAWQKTEAEIYPDENGVYRFEQLAEDTDTNLLFEEQIMYELGYDWEQYCLKDMYIPSSFDSVGYIAEIAAAQRAIARDNIVAQATMLAEFRANPAAFEPQRTAAFAYNRAAAVAYANAWVGEGEILRNPDYMDLSEMGGNCQNFASQCLHAGGIPMDWSGELLHQWKFFSLDIEYAELPRGRAPAWAGTGFFYDYCMENTDGGPVVEEGENLYSARPGDVLQFMEDGWPRHSVVVTGYLYDAQGEIVDLLIASNTTDCKNYPLSAYGYTGVRLLRVIGYN